MPKNMLQAVIDTNILVRANINKRGSDYLIYKYFLESKFELLYSEQTIKEIKRVLYYPRIYKKYHFQGQIIEDFVSSILEFGKMIFSPEKVKICRDPEDDELLSIAKFAYHKNPIYIVTGDEDLLVLDGKIKGVRIMQASKFLKIVAKKYKLTVKRVGFIIQSHNKERWT